jgi:hypothetical protein
VSNFTIALAALKSQLVSNLSVPVAVRILHPDYDATTITSALANLPAVPVLVLFQNTHSEIIVLSDSPAAREAMGTHDEWFDRMAVALEADRTLGGAVISVGDGDLFRGMVGEIPWNKINYWGIQFIIPIKEER